MSESEIKRLQTKALMLAQELELARNQSAELGAILQRHLDWYDGKGPPMHREEENRLIRHTREALSGRKS